MESKAQWEVGDRLGDKWYLGAAPLETREKLNLSVPRSGAESDPKEKESVPSEKFFDSD